MGAFRYRYPVSAEIAGKLLLFLFPLPTGSHGFVPEIQFSGVPLVRLYYTSSYYHFCLFVITTMATVLMTMTFVVVAVTTVFFTTIVVIA